MTEKENTLLTNKHILISIDEQSTDQDQVYGKELQYIKNNFCGIVLSDTASLTRYDCSQDVIIYLSGNVEKNKNVISSWLQKNKTLDGNRLNNCILNVIQELSYNYENDSADYKVISIGQVPVNIYNVGVYFRNLFDQEPDKDYFNLINNAHQFQALTESNKPTNAFRTGIYLTKVQESDEGIKFRLLRCSSNLHGPTDNFRDPDIEIVGRVNGIAERFFEEKTPLNHVLAQIYENKIVNTGTKQVERKAKIKDHSDKTKDMPRNGLIAFCTFYKKYRNGQFNDTELKHIKKSNNDYFDYRFNNTSVLTRICFRLKKMVTDPTLKNKFDIVLYPGSVFLIPLSMNRLYTHEIVPSILPIDKIPTRMGYVIRCSKTNAIFKDDQTYINEDGTEVKLEEPDKEAVQELKRLYFKENTTADIIYYNKLYFSLNAGDYQKPIV
jgi:hypothetical protein